MEWLDSRPLAWLAVVCVTAVATRWSLSDRPRGRWWLATIFRWLGMTLLVVSLCRPVLECLSSRQHVIHLVDASESQELAAVRERLDGLGRMATASPTSLRSETFLFGAGVRAGSPGELLACVDSWTAGIPDSAFRGRTQMAGAMQTARHAFLHGAAKELVLHSDGMDTEDSLAGAVAALEAEGGGVSGEVPWRGWCAMRQLWLPLRRQRRRRFSGRPYA